ncbi:hypothetical protein MLD38_037288 [Melastoma candidum]|uniref:Uncharacterized protein n=1 Tax=Melastoma candidum TaxID=119954 RepID=A0ACB9LLM7_9MYRT|nr:hypothetical protein MLD38_037288 [Melastoma candidum]
MLQHVRQNTVFCFRSLFGSKQLHHSQMDAISSYLQPVDGSHTGLQGLVVPILAALSIPQKTTPAVSNGAPFTPDPQHIGHPPIQPQQNSQMIALVPDSRASHPSYSASGSDQQSPVLASTSYPPFAAAAISN